MSFDLVIGDRYPSSWSLRGWLLFEKFNIEHKLHHVSFINDRLVEEQMPEFAPAKTVPTVRTPEGGDRRRQPRHSRGTGQPLPRREHFAKRSCCPGCCAFLDGRNAFRLW